MQNERSAEPAMYVERPSGRPTMQDEAQPQAPLQANTDLDTRRVSRFAHPQHHIHPALRGSQRTHPSGSPATSINAYTDGRSLLDPVLAWHKGQDSTSLAASAQQHPLPQSRTIISPDLWTGDYFYSGVDSTAASSPLGDYKYQARDFAPSLLETSKPRFMNPQSPEMQTPPLSAHPSPNNAAMEEQTSRKRSHSVMSSGEKDFQQQMIAAANAHHAVLANGARPGSRSASVTSAGVETDGYSGRGSRAFKRGDPPQNEHGKYICDYTEDCRNVTFDRKCEWSKHMDKHDRPYRCPHESCGKLQGFTYSGGLLRHEREVHGKHGGPKAQLMCPHADCKRHAGKGFTRKENLNEHLRRVHFSRNPDSQDAGLGADEDVDVDSAAQDAIAALNASGSAKRKRSLDDDLGNTSDITLLRQEIAMLRAENDRKDAVIQELTRQLAHYSQNIEQVIQESVPGYQQG